ncbi:TetR/AcrR family transcriptional regulator [Quadrisphaera sp. INWT6]|uniref:TetR/AcrR family transcriptional regulator n=1 Tax=Quadrisphaera sp. INWT6 TaxID=2596917 RepID=UPI001892621C|nr:TetR/AcrR family transcriptional regulator [Quadrisphaera sp. INWT6]MBF5081797.1 TetR/AcrR family transcriptional regulator [Quadrisphaera sp. INWT6]
MSTASATTTARERARRELTAEILSAARRQLAEVGAAALSVRAVARELGLASSAVYRYFATRDDLLTALIVEAYDSAGAAVEAAARPTAPGRTPRERFTAACTALRSWALEHPHEYALVHGSPVPGYRGDSRTTAAGSRAPLALLHVLADADPAPRRPVSAALAEQAARVTAAAGDGPAGRAAPEVVVAGARAWTALLGLVSSEVFGQLANTFDPADAFAAATVEALADDLGL